MGRQDRLRGDNSSEHGGKRKPGPPKTGKRIVMLDDDMILLLKNEQDYQHQREAALGDRWVESGHVFASVTGTIISPNNLRRDMKRICMKAGVQYLGPHSLRHTYATLMGRARVPIEVVSKQLGHSSIFITLKFYRHVFADERRHHVKSLKELLPELPAATNYGRQPAGVSSAPAPGCLN
ncbi:hypothetical protein CTI14_01785 [Methylobacterium radiotolerans]|nr:hypothetical protein CTI14_01785 [Methylobacterium radiotolerans]